MIVCRCERVTAGEIRALDPRRRARPERAEGDHARRHGRLRRQDLPQPDQAAVPRGGRARQPDHRLHEAAGVHGGAARRLRRRRGRRRPARRCPGRATPPTRTKEACDEHRHLRRRHRRRRQRRPADGAVPGRTGHQAARHRPVRERRPGQQQGRHRRHPRHALVARRRSTCASSRCACSRRGSRPTATTSSGPGAATRSSRTASRRSGR